MPGAMVRYGGMEAGKVDGVMLTVDLQGVDGSNVVGFRAKREAAPIDLSLVNHYEASDYWERIYRERGSIVLEPGDFYILTSKEKVSVPPHMAAEMLPFDPAVGEFRIHYAGFFDPGFGWNHSVDQQFPALGAVPDARTLSTHRHGAPPVDQGRRRRG